MKNIDASFAVLKIMILSLILLNTNGFSQPGALDPTFGNAGKIFSVGSITLQSIVLQNDGKILASGSSQLMRYSSNGILDNTFGTNGIVDLTPFYAGPVTIQTDGKILVAGGTTGGIAIKRLNTNRIIDDSFGINGTSVPHSGVTNAIELQSDGKILITGYVDIDEFGSSLPILLRYKSNGVIDSTFGINGNGVTYPNLGGNIFDIAYSIGLQNDGKIIVVGDASGHFGVSRCDSTGIMDQSFELNGNSIQLSSGYSPAYSVAIQSNGYFIVAGLSHQTSMAMVRFNSLGVIDSTFGLNGVVIAESIYQGMSITRVKIQNDGKILLGGVDNGDFIIQRYDTNGIIDNSFGISGIVTTDFSGNFDLSKSLALQQDGKIILAGYGGNGPTYDLEMARYYGGDTNPTSTELDLNDKSTLSVFPMPFQDELTIKLNCNEGIIKLFDVLGKEVLKMNFSNQEIKINTSKLAYGAYFLNYSNKNEAKTLRLIKGN